MSAPHTPRVNLYGAIAANRARTVFLIIAFGVIVAALAYVVGEYLAPGGGFALAPLSMIVSGGSAFVSYYAGDKLVLAQSAAREIGPDEEKVLRSVVESLALGLGIPVPRVYVIDDSAPNAFATGRDPKHASIAVTRGLLDKLDRGELEGVIAHELSHIGNRDIRVMLLVTILVGMVALLADWMLRSMVWGGGGRRRNREGSSGGGIIVVLALALALLPPIIATLIQLAVSREREYLADASGALLTRYPAGLADALRKIDADQEPLEVANKATASLYIANPLRDRRALFDGLFNTHPPIAERIKRLEAMG